MNTTQPSTPDPIQAAAMECAKKLDDTCLNTEGCTGNEYAVLDLPQSSAIIATAMRELVAEYAERERAAIASWDEERKRALREADRVVVKDAENARLRERVAELEGADIDRNRLTLELENMSSGYMRAQDRLAAANERVAELEKLVSDLNGSYDGGRLDMIADWHDARLKREGRDADLKSGRSDGAVIRATIGHIRELESQLAAANERVAGLEADGDRCREKWSHYEKEYFAVVTQLAAARRDAERLDWLDDNMSCVGGGAGATYSFKTPADVECGMLRAAIDAAMQREGGK